MNRITCIQDNLGNWVEEEEEEVAEVIRKGYFDLFCFDKISAPRSVWIIPNWTTHFLEEARCSMVEGISPLDIKTALWSFKPFKAPGPDGLHAGFYQKFWPVVGEAVCKVVLEAFRSGSVPAYLNQTLLVMILKCQGPESIGNYRPISLCNTIYKLITKLIVLKIRPFLDQVISPLQSAFVPGRRGLDNMIIAQELIHTLSLKHGREGYMAIKIDLEKAYDRLEWNFVRDMLLLFKVPDPLIKLIMSCFASPSISVLLNGG